MTAAELPHATSADAATAPPLLGGRGLACGRGTPVLRGVDLEVRAGESWFVVGPNGAGKSTLLATLLGLLRPLAGTVLPVVGGRRDQVGYVPQAPRDELPLPVAVAEFVASGVPDHEPRALAAARSAAALAALGLTELAMRDMRRLSTGQRRRCFVARALARQPRLLVLDEPTANLDPGTALALAADLERLRRLHGTALVHTSHDLHLVRRFATHVAFVADGSVHAGPRDAVLAAPAVALALGEVPA